jgi:hypothetical protein
MGKTYEKPEVDLFDLTSEERIAGSGNCAATPNENANPNAGCVPYADAPSNANPWCP